MNIRKFHLLGAACICSLTVVSQGATAAALDFDANVTPGIIMGDGIGTGSWTVNQNNNVELGLRGKLRFNGSGAPENTYNSNGDGTYSFAAIVAPTKASPVAEWSFEWSINSAYASSGPALNDLSYELGIDNDPGAGQSWGTFDPVNDNNPNTATVFWDHSLGDNSTTAATDSIATDATDYGNLIAVNNVAQNSWQAHWFLAGFDPTVDGQYDFYLAASDGSGEIARTEMSIIVGSGAAVVPLPAAVWLFGSALLGLGALRRRKA